MARAKLGWHYCGMKFCKTCLCLVLRENHLCFVKPKKKKEVKKLKRNQMYDNNICDIVVLSIIIFSLYLVIFLLT